jgi:3D (Asp-Asp-Asp) domain-containing protein
MIQRLTRFVRLPLLLGLAAVAAFTASTLPAIHQKIRLDGQPPADGYGPICLLRAAPFGGSPDLWNLDHPRQIFPFELISAGYTESELQDYTVVARVTCTAYTSRICETDSTPFITASNKSTRSGYIALSRDLLVHYTPGAPFRYGDRVAIIGIGTFQVEDTMNPRWTSRADIWVPHLETAWAWGRRTVIIAKIESGNSRGDLALNEVLPVGREGT